jgi:hypothetical protein
MLIAAPPTSSRVYKELNLWLFLSVFIIIHSTLVIVVLKSIDTPVNIRRFKKLLRLLKSRDNLVWLFIKLKSSAKKDINILITSVIPVYKILN